MNTNDVRICFVGDSYVQGTGDPDCLGWVGRLCVAARRAGHNLTGYNLGVRRETSTDIAHRWLAECASRLPANTQNTVVFSFGANDVTIENDAPRVAEAETLLNLRTLLDTATSRYRMLLIGPPATTDAAHNARLGQLSQRMGELAAQTDVPYLALFPVLVKDAHWLAEVSANDGAHPRAAGYAKIAALIGTWPAWRYR
jgi:acyl-CoA thioesterase I